jgi:phosphoserine phosphatase
MSGITPFDPAEFEGFVYRESYPDDELESVHSKLYRFREASNGLLTLVIDWDDTVADGTWPQLRKLMHPDIAAMSSAMYKLHQREQHDDTLTPGKAEAWQRAALGHLVGMNINDIIAAGSSTPLRPGAKELFATCEEHGITPVVKSGAVKQFIQASAKANGIDPEIIIIATDLQPNRRDTVTGWDPETMTHSRNKGELEHPDLPDPYQGMTILVGDGLADRRMVPFDSDALLIRANGGFRGDEKQILKSFEIERPYDIVAVEPDLLAVAGLVDYLVRPQE